MQAIEFNVQIGKNGHIFLPERFHHFYGREARLLMLIPEQTESGKKPRRPGSAKGVLTILYEDDDHLDDFKAYMP